MMRNAWTRRIALNSITKTLAACALLLCLAYGCSREPDGPVATEARSDENRLLVFVGIAPQKLFAQRVGGDRVDVQVLVEQGQDPHVFEPGPRQLMLLSRSRLFFRVGMQFEDRLLSKLPRESGPTIIDTTEGIEKRRMSAHDHEEKDEHHEDESGFDPHIWLSPPLIKIQAKNMAKALIAADPARRQTYETNLDEFMREVDATDARIREILGPVHGARFYVFHPSFGYFADAYGLEQEAVEFEGKSPTPKQLRGLIDSAKTDGVKTVFVQPQFDNDSAKTVADAIGGVVMPLDALSGDVLDNLVAAAEAIRGSLAGKGDTQP